MFMQHETYFKPKNNCYDILKLKFNNFVIIF